MAMERFSLGAHAALLHSRNLAGVLSLASFSLLGCAAKAEFNTPPPVATPLPQPVQSVAAPQPTGDAVLDGDHIKIARPIFYDTDKDLIKPESYPVLAAVAGVLTAHPEIVTVTVEGHTDNQGSFDHNRELSEHRANAVVKYLVSIGVKQQVLSAGYGATAPLCGGVDEGCRQQNRRVEFRVKRAP
jgi:peptidoglycan-associated lipoprotein